MPEYKCFCKKPRRQQSFFTASIEEAITEAANKWEVSEILINASRINMPAEFELRKQKEEEGGRVMRKHLG